jgi:RNA recognition motif-containing protein
MSYPRQSILFISGLEKSINETNLYSLFNDFPISYVKIAKDHNTRESFGYAFVGFKSHAKGKALKTIFSFEFFFFKTPKKIIKLLNSSYFFAAEFPLF